MSGDVEYGARCIHRLADDLVRRYPGHDEAVVDAANMRACARRLGLLARSLKRVAPHA